ncbi:MAG: hypothetical protein MR487_04195 [Lachnospiraceae bacterium]|nr:hypothetical protein [Lachnospiraceae bacterium]
MKNVSPFGQKDCDPARKNQNPAQECENLPVIHKFQWELAKSTHHPSEKTKRSTDSREVPALLDKKVAFWKEITKRSTYGREAPAFLDKKLRHHMMPQFEILAEISKFIAKPPLCIQL